jgi:allantoin racemase
MHAASFISTRFSVVTTLERTCVITENLLMNYGMERLCRRVRSTELAVLDLEKPGSDAQNKVIEECRRAVTEDRAGAIVLGCAGMTDLCAAVSHAVGVPVIDGVSAAVTFVEALVRLKLGTSKHGDYAYPLPKTYTGSMSIFAP